ncbi:MAG: YihY/virulence factor BrkB family protein [Actinomycetota bacterium]|nr:YihY/virulence factor BrkB family protein [Actinomycetota bacterium]
MRLGPLIRAAKRFRADQMIDHAAGLTFYLMLSLFPALLASVALLGLLGGTSLITDATDYVRDSGASPAVVDGVQASLSGTIEGAGGAVNAALVLGLAVALYGASGAFGAAGRALNVVYGVDEDRGFVRKKATNLAFTLVVLALALVALACVFVGGSLANAIFGLIGLGDTAAGIWRVARWVVAIVAAMLIYSVVYAFAPDHPDRRFHWITPGSALGVVMWLLASAGFFFYVANFGNYQATYGVFAGAVILLLWLWITNLAFLFGAELNVELQRQRTAGRAGPPPPTPPPPTPSPGAPAPG